VEHGLRAVLGLDDDVRLAEAGVDVAPLVAARLVEERLAFDSLLGVEQRLSRSAARACPKLSAATAATGAPW